MIFIMLMAMFASLKGFDMQSPRVVDVTHTLNSHIPTWDLSCGFTSTIVWDYKNSTSEFKVRAQTFEMKASAGTHMDAPAHFFEGSTTIDNIEVEKLVVACIVIDTSARMSEDYCVSLNDIKEFESKYGQIPTGSFVIFYTGWSQYWDNPKQYHNNYKFPSVSVEVARYLVERNVVGIGVDTLSPDSGGTEFYVHTTVLGAKKIIVENIAHAHLLPPVGATIMIMPLKIEGATESPVRLVAVLPH
jgi:kynurenine formamidase